MCIAALFMIVRNWKQSKCSSMDDWLNKLRYVHTVEYYSTIKWNNTVKNLPAVWETWVWSLGWEDPLENGMTTSSNILAWKIPMDRGACQVAVYGVANSKTCKELDTTEQLSTAQLWFLIIVVFVWMYTFVA